MIGADVENVELKALVEVSRVLTSSFDLEVNLNAVMKCLGEILDMQRGCVYLIEDDHLRIVAAYGLKEEEIRRGKYRIGEGIVGSVIASQRPMFIPNIGSEPRFLNRTGARPRKEGISFLCVPIMHNKEVLGVVSVDRIYAPESGDVDDDLRVLSVVATLIAQFVTLWKIYTEADRERRNLRIALQERYSIPNLIGESERFQAVLKTVTRVAATDATVLLLGESGTGKELIARTIHHHSERRKGPFVPVNCAALPDNLIELELFGAERGAFTGATERRIGRFERANGGTIFLDEIGELSVAVQVKLLRVLQERTFERLGSSESLKTDVRIIAATNRNLEEEVKKGNFREDLYWRLNVVSIRLPPLRERKEDIPLLVNYFLRKFNKKYRKNVSISDEIMRSFIDYSWPGNIRELANVLERLVIMSETDRISELDEDLLFMGGIKGRPLTPEGALLTELQELEKERILRALRKNNFIQARAARDLGLTLRQLGYRIKKYGIRIDS